MKILDKFMKMSLLMKIVIGGVLALVIWQVVSMVLHLPYQPIALVRMVFRTVVDKIAKRSV